MVKQVNNFHLNLEEFKDYGLTSVDFMVRFSLKSIKICELLFSKSTNKFTERIERFQEVLGTYAFG